LPDNPRPIPYAMLEALSRNFCREATGYGFRRVDFLRYINLLMDAAVKSADEHAAQPGSAVPAPGCDAATTVAARAGLPLRGERIVIRDFEADADLPRLERWLEDVAGRFFMLSRNTSGDTRPGAMVAGSDNLVGTVTLHDGTPIGVVAFLDLDTRHRKAELRKLIGEPGMRGRGFAKEASRLWIEHGVSRLGLRKIYLNTTHTNLRNLRINEELGFQVEGILRNEICVDGVYHDVLRMGLWRES
jgi:RimJ/RimL family protein N-acetyltransferase